MGMMATKRWYDMDARQHFSKMVSDFLDKHLMEYIVWEKNGEGEMSQRTCIGKLIKDVTKLIETDGETMKVYKTKCYLSGYSGLAIVAAYTSGQAEIICERNIDGYNTVDWSNPIEVSELSTTKEEPGIISFVYGISRI